MNFKMAAIVRGQLVPPTRTYAHVLMGGGGMDCEGTMYIRTCACGGDGWIVRGQCAYIRTCACGGVGGGVIVRGQCTYVRTCACGGGGGMGQCLQFHLTTYNHLA